MGSEGKIDTKLDSLEVCVCVLAGVKLQNVRQGGIDICIQKVLLCYFLSWL